MFAGAAGWFGFHCGTLLSAAWRPLKFLEGSVCSIGGIDSRLKFFDFFKWSFWRTQNCIDIQVFTCLEDFTSGPD